MNTTDNVRRAFRSKYSFDIQTTWLQACLTWLRDQFQLPDLTNQYALEKVYNQWLHTDISLIADAHYLPNDLDLNAKKVQLTGKYPLQINNILCISEPYYSQVLDIHGDQNENERIDTDITETQQWKPPAPKRVLYLELTDGKILLRGLEYEPIANLDRDTTLPGAKILVTGPVLFRRGMLLLTSKNTQILGGYVESLLEKNTSLENTLLSLSKTAMKLNESRKRFDQLNVKVHASAIIDNIPLPIAQTNPSSNTFDNNEDEMDEFIRQAYADGMLNDDSHISLPEPIPPPPPPPQLSSTNRLPTPTNQREECVVLSDDEIAHLDFDDFPTSVTIDQIPSQPSAPVLKIPIPFTYLSLIDDVSQYSTQPYNDYLIKACFSSLFGNPKIVGEEFVQQAYINDGSAGRLIQFASDILAQHFGMSAIETMARRKQCRDQFEQKQFQMEFNQRLKDFGKNIQHICTTMTIRVFSDKKQTPIIMTIDSN